MAEIRPRIGRSGVTVDLIDAETRKLARDSPPKPLTYFEKVFATSFAKRQRPLPVVEVSAPEKLTVISNGKPQFGNGIIQAADRLNTLIAGFEDGISGTAGSSRPEDLCGEAGPPPVRLLPQG